MTERLTSVLVDADDREAYPIAGYTYFIVRMSEMTNCDSAVETREVSGHVISFSTVVCL